VAQPLKLKINCIGFLLFKYNNNFAFILAKEVQRILKKISYLKQGLYCLLMHGLYIGPSVMVLEGWVGWYCGKIER